MCIHLDAATQAQPLPRFDAPALDTRHSGARSAAEAYVLDLLVDEVPALRGEDATLGIVAIARRPGVLSKVVVRPTVARLAPRVTDAALGAGASVMAGVARVPGPALVPGIGADHLARVSQLLDGERIDVLRWQRSAPAFIADALGLAEVPPMLLLPGLGHARVLLGEIDVRGIAGWRDVNVILASAVTGWRLRLEPVAATAAWARLRAAMVAKRSVTGTVVGRTPRGVRVEVFGLYAVFSGQAARRDWPVDHEVEVQVTRMDPDEGRVFVTDRATPSGQLSLL